MEGGFLKQPHVLGSIFYPGPDGCDVECLAISKTAKWLAEAVTGRHVSQRCMGRCTVFDEMRQKVLDRPVLCPHGSGDDLVAGLGYEDDDAVVSTPRSRKRRRGGADETLESDIDKTPAKAEIIAKVIKVRATASADAETVDVTVVYRRKSVLLRLQDLPWLPEYLRSEIEQVPAVGEMSDDDEKRLFPRQSFGTSTIPVGLHAKELQVVNNLLRKGLSIAERGPPVMHCMG